MKKRILLVALMAMLLVMAFAISVSAETPSMYIEFGARFPGNDQYITVYTENAESSGNPQINFETKKFYSDINFTQEVDMSTATGIDFSVAKSFYLLYNIFLMKRGASMSKIKVLTDSGSDITLEQAKAQIEEKNIEILNRTIMQLRIKKDR